MGLRETVRQLHIGGASRFAPKNRVMIVQNNQKNKNRRKLSC